MHPTFAFERDKFLVGDDEDPMRWCGLREGRVLVRVWTRASEGKDGKGKEKATSEDGLGGDWKLLVEWDVAFDGLVSLGRDVSRRLIFDDCRALLTHVYSVADPIPQLTSQYPHLRPLRRVLYSGTVFAHFSPAVLPRHHNYRLGRVRIRSL